MDTQVTTCPTAMATDRLVVQLGVKHGRALDLVRSNGHELTIGRAYNNDLVLADEYVAANHLRLYVEPEDGEWYVQVLDDCNDVLLNRRKITSSEGPQRIHSGDALTLGRTRLGLFSEQHPVASPRKLMASRWQQGAAGIWLPILMLLGYVGTSVMLTQWMTRPVADPFKGIESALVAVLTVTLIWTGAWALVGKVFRNQANFLPQLLMVSVLSLVSVPLLLLPDWLMFTTNTVMAATVAEYVAYVVFGIVVLRYHLLLSTNLLKTWMVACIVGVLGLSGFLAARFGGSQYHFVRGPEYPAVVQTDALYLGPVHSLDQYMTLLDQDIDQLAAEAPGKPDPSD